MTKVAKSRPVRGRRALRSAAKDLGYEWWMARSTGEAAISALLRRDRLALNMALESFIIHTRNIRDFFGSRGKADDVLVADFLGRPLRVSLPHLRSRAVRNRMNKRVAHLSYARARLKRGWNLPVLLREMNNAMDLFLARLDRIDPALARMVRGAA